MATIVATKQVHIIARYHIKKNGYVCYRVLSSNGKDQYCTTLNAQGKATGCTCPCRSPKGCYHMTQLQVIEQQRRGVTPPAAPAQTREQQTEAANQKRAQAAARKAREELAQLEAQLEQQLNRELTRTGIYAIGVEPEIEQQLAQAAMPLVSDIEQRMARAGFMR